jgi:hypothetical protein
LFINLVKWLNVPLLVSTSFQPDVSVEAETGKLYRANFTDREGKTVVVMRPAKKVSSFHFWSC